MVEQFCDGTKKGAEAVVGKLPEWRWFPPEGFQEPNAGLAKAAGHHGEADHIVFLFRRVRGLCGPGEALDCALPDRSPVGMKYENDIEAQGSFGNDGIADSIYIV